MKYVLNSVNEKFVLFPEKTGISHSEIRSTECKWDRAGFVNLDFSAKDECNNVFIEAICHGESVSLNLKCGLEDSEIITKILNRS